MTNTNNSNALQVMSIEADGLNLYIKARNEKGVFFSTYSFNKNGKKNAAKIAEVASQCPLEKAYQFKKACYEKGLLKSNMSNEQENRASFDALLAQI